MLIIIRGLIKVIRGLLCFVMLGIYLWCELRQSWVDVLIKTLAYEYNCHNNRNNKQTGCLLALRLNHLGIRLLAGPSHTVSLH